MEPPAVSRAPGASSRDEAPSLDRRRRELGQSIAIGILFAGSLAAIFGPALWNHARLASDPGVFNNDSRAQIPPFFRYEDPNPFRNDYVGDYYLACFPWGYRGMYTAAALLGGAEALSKALPYVLLLVTVGGISLAAHRVGGLFAGWAAAALCLGSSAFLGPMAGGLPRSFAPPLLACVLAGLAYGRVRLLIACVWLGALFYPVIAVIAGISLTLFLLDPIPRDRGIAPAWPLRKRISVLIGTGLVALMMQLPVWILSAKYGPVIRPAQGREYPETGPGGRLAAHNRYPYRGPLWQSVSVLSGALPGAGEPLSRLGRSLGADSSGRRVRIAFVLLTVASIGWVLLALRRPEARRILILPVAALLGHWLAVWLMPLLYIPSRYIRYVLPALAIVVLAAGSIGLVPERIRVRRPRLPGRIVAIFCAATLLLIGGRGSPDVGLSVRVDASDPIYEFIGSLPADSLVAGWPSGVLDNVPYVARRTAFATYETHQPFHSGYILEMRRRVDALIDAYFATTAEPLVRLQREFGVTHLLIDLGMLRNRSASYFKPFDRRVSEAMNRIGDQELEVIRQLEHAEVFRHGELAVLDLRRVRSDGSVRRPRASG